MNEILYFNTPAKCCEEALPIGGGNLGAMIFGGEKQLRIQLNEISLWSGGPFEAADRENAFLFLPQIRELINSKQYDKAASLINREFTNKGGGFDGAYSAAYQTLGDIYIKFHIKESKCLDYSRILDLQTAIVSDEAIYNNIKIRREYFASHDKNVIAVRIFTDTPAGLSIDISYKRENLSSLTYTESGFAFSGHCDSDDSHMAFAGALRVFNEGGSAYAQAECFSVKNADSVILYFSAATDYAMLASSGFKSGSPEDKLSRALSAVSLGGYDEMKRQHISEYKSYYDRNRLALHCENRDDIPLDIRLKKNIRQDDAGLVNLLFNYGKYLLISCSRPDNILPANLQGMWCWEYKPAWHCDYHTNINVQMNYWCAGPANLTECTEPFARLIEALVENGRKTAKSYYNAEGWTLYTITNPFLWTSPGWDGGWAQYPLGGAWLCKHLVEYYNYSCDKSLLERFYPVIRENCLFNIDILYKDENGYYMTNPATSPENSFCDDEGNRGWVCKATAMDIEMLYENFSDMLRICSIMDRDYELQERLREILPKLRPLKIGKAGQLCEWEGDWDLNAEEPQHRHVSHLYGLHPGTMISIEKTPQLAEACKKSLELRGDDGTGWSLAWKINFWARLYDGNHAYKLIKRLLKPVLISEKLMYQGGGVYPNLFDAHPPFQIDGNFGAVSGVCEMLLQSHVLLEGGEFLLNILPALPEAFPAGEVHRLLARGNTEVSVFWENCKAVKVLVKSKTGGRIALKGFFSAENAAFETEKKDGITYLKAEKNVEYCLVPSNFKEN